MFRNNYLKPIYIKKSNKVAQNFYDAFLLGCAIVFILSCIFNIVFFPAEVVGPSMQPTINAEYTSQNKKSDLVYASKFFECKRGDIILVDLPTIQDDAIKRLIAIGGDTLGFGDLDNNSESTIYLNGKILIEDYLKGNSNIECVNRFKTMIKTKLLSGMGEGFSVEYNEVSAMYQMKLDDDYCVFLGDNRDNSQDCSRPDLGPQKTTSIHAKVLIHLPYGYNLLTYFSAKLFGYKFD